jgi:hypothetical protein
MLLQAQSDMFSIRNMSYRFVTTVYLRNSQFEDTYSLSGGGGGNRTIGAWLIKL